METGKLIKFIIVPGIIIGLLILAFRWQLIAEFIKNETLVFRLTLLIGALGFLLILAPVIQARLRLLAAGKHKPLSEKECRKIVLKWVAENFSTMGAASQDGLNIIAQRLDGTDFEAPFGWFAVTTEPIHGTNKLRMNEFSRDKLFVCFVNRINGDVSYQPGINNEVEADALLKDIRFHSLPYDKIKPKSELDVLIDKETAVGYGTQHGRDIASKGKDIKQEGVK